MLKPSLEKQKTVLYCPLNWGLGHASRSVPVIRTLSDLGFNVIIAADKAPLAFLLKQFPTLEWVKFKGFEPKYTKGKNLFFKLFWQLIPAFWFYWLDKQFVREQIKKRKIDLIISDNRFGALNKNIPSVIITHQLNLQLPGSLRLIKPIANKLNRYLIKQFDQCWIPDFKEKSSFSGNLSIIPSNFIPTVHLGILSRFRSLNAKPVSKDIDVLVLLSGPEPQRSILESICINQLSITNFKSVILRGLPQNKSIEQNFRNIKLMNHAPDNVFENLVSRSRMIICRGGYSTIMDLACLNKSAWLVPTPGQSEQEYLASFLSGKKWFNTINQSEIQIDKIFDSDSVFKPPLCNGSLNKLKSLLSEQLQSLGIT